MNVQELACGYQGRIVVEGISIPPGLPSPVGILGRNGGGKSTFLKTCAGLLDPISGAVLVGEERVHDLQPRHRAQRVAYVPPEEPHIFPYSVRESVLMGRSASSGWADSAEDQARADEAIEVLDLVQLADRPCTQLSAGERQRVGLARAWCQGAEHLLLDEPTSHLDPAHVLMLSRLISAETKRIFVATHDLNWGASVCASWVIFSEGRVNFTGSVAEAMAGDALEAAFGVSFRRIADPGGGLPILMLS